jgi:hypothetical protein
VHLANEKRLRSRFVATARRRLLLGALAHLRPEPLAVAHVVLPAPIFAKEHVMNNIIWLVGAVVIVIAILSFLGLR